MKLIDKLLDYWFDVPAPAKHVTGTIKEIVPNANGTVRVKLDVNGDTRWTTWKS